MKPLSFLSPKTIVRESPIHGRGLFAREKIAQNEIVAVKGGHIIDRQTLAGLQPTLGPAEIQISDTLYICPTTPEEREASMLYSNHSCAANLGMRGEITFVAMREIAAGEELTHDWAMTDNDDLFVRRGEVSWHGDRTGLATAGSAATIRRLFLGLSARENAAIENL